MRYLPHTMDDIASMLETIGVSTIDDLFSAIPKACLHEKDLDLPTPLSEWELEGHAKTLADSVADSSVYKVFIGAGSYDHFVPAALSYLLGRSEFTTAYTPYQPEISQGTLQAIFEYQTYVSRLLGMEVSNASMYDGATALAEALLMAIRITRKKTVAVSMAVHPFYRKVIESYFRPTEFKVIYVPFLENGRTDLDAIPKEDELAGVAVQSPNFFGIIEDLAKAGKQLEQNKALFITCFTEPLAYGIYKNPGDMGADIVCGEGQSFGIPKSFGGPGLGMFATKTAYVRNMPGRLVGETIDKDLKKGYVLTLATREQHIRREKATSNICSNQGLCALASAMYMAFLGGTGIQELAKLNYDKAEYLKAELKSKGFAIPFENPTFNEFVVEFPKGFEKTREKLLKKKIVPGLCLESFYPELTGCNLVCVTETFSKGDMDLFIKGVAS